MPEALTLAEDPVWGYLVAWGGLVACVAASVRFISRHRTNPTVRARIVANGLVTVTLLLAVLLAFESYMRYGFKSTTWQASALVTRKWFREAVHMNSAGFRDREFEAAKRPGVRRVVFIGDSYTFGYGVRDPDDRFPDRVRSDLARTRPGGYEVRNLGSIGASTRTELRILTGALAFQRLDHVVIAYSPNDVDDLFPRGENEMSLASAPLEGVLFEQSFALDFLFSRLRVARSGEAQRYFDALDAVHRDPDAWDSQTLAIRAIAVQCRRAGVRLDVVIFPLFSHWCDAYPFDEWHERAARAWEDTGARTLDLRAAYRGVPADELVVNAYDAHPNERAHAIAADAILSAVFPDDE